MSARYLPTRPAQGGGWVTTPTGARLYIQADAKTSPAVTIDGNGSARADVHNAFVLPVGPLEHGGACPATTTACGSCYAAGSESLSPSLARNAAANLATLRDLYGTGGRAGAARVAAALVAVVEHSAAQQRARGVARPLFRWQSGGDLFATWYARAIRAAMVAAPGVDHWLYTRTTTEVRGLLPVPDNGRVYLSGDRWNVAQVARASARYGLPVAILADDLADAAALWARMAAAGASSDARPVSCPATDRYARDGIGVAAHVVGPDGRRASARPGAPGVGACASCAVCLPGGTARGVTFLLHGGGTLATGQRLAGAVRRRIPVAVVS